MVVYLLRHTESEFNADPSSTMYDCGLTPTGRAQAAAIPYFTADLILCSPLRRARETLSLLPHYTKRVWYWDMLREVRTDPCDFLEGEPLLMETETEVLARVEAVRDFLRDNQWSKDNCKKKPPTIYVVGHADFFWYLTSRVGDDGVRYGHWMKNGEVFLLN